MPPSVDYDKLSLPASNTHFSDHPDDIETDSYNLYSKDKEDLLWEICEFGQKSFTPGGWLVYPSDLPVWPGKKTNRRPTVQ